MPADYGERMWGVSQQPVVVLRPEMPRCVGILPKKYERSEARSSLTVEELSFGGFPTPYDPLAPGLQFLLQICARPGTRSGVRCDDSKNRQDHD